MCLGQFYLEMDLETASEMASFPWYQNKRKEKAARIIKGKYAWTGKFLKLFVLKKTQQLPVSSSFSQFKVAARPVPPKQSHKSARA